MPTRASQQEQVASAGVGEVSAAFARIGWGVVENSRHDLGTDLFLLARDERLFDLGLVVGAQVKAGQSYFAEPVQGEDSGPLGWWFRDSDRSHVDAWASHGLPHVLVLHDLDSNTSYWVHVTPDVIESTGSGAKVFVPVENTVDVEHREALLAVAATLRSSVTWEGSAWTGSAGVAPADALRHALIVPRLVAPHPNAGHEMALTPAQAVALLVQARVGDLEDFASSQPGVPSLGEARDSPDWEWRFVGVLGERITTDAVDGLLSVIDDAPDAATRTAATVTAASALLVDGRADDAVALLEAAIERDDAGTVDHSWLTGQRARARAEIGRVDDARTDAVAVQAVRMAAAQDVTATAIAGSAAVLLFNTSAWGQQDVADVIAGADTAATWWRTQTASWGLDALAQRTFSAWARDTSVRVGGPDVANNQLFAAALLASHAGDQGGWRHLAGLLGRDMLMRLDREANPARAREGLTALRLAGEDAALKLVVRRLVADGPAIAVTLAAADVRLEVATRTTGPADLMLLQQGGDVLDEPCAERTVAWLLATLANPAPFETRTSPSYLLELRLVETLAAVVASVSVSTQGAVIEHLIALSGQEQLLATAWAPVIDALPHDAWSEEPARRLAENAGTHHDELRVPALGVLARYDEATRAALTSEAQAGSLDALAALGDVRELPGEVVSALIAGLAEQVRQQVEQAHAGHFGFGGHDVGSGLGLLNVWYPQAAAWDPLLDLLADDAVAVEHKLGALHTLGTLADQLPADIQERLKPIAVAAAERPSGPSSPFAQERDAMGPGTYLAAALGALDADGAASRLLKLLAGDANHRQWAAQVARRLGRPEDIGVLAALAQDPDPDVRGAAGAGLASVVAEDQGGALAASALQLCLVDPGTRTPANVAAVLAGAPARGKAAREALDQLRTHVSANVRSLAAHSAD